MYNGIINVYKEKGFTSHDVVAKLRGILKQKKIGHTGTLDPDATGVLPVCLGNATKLCDMLTDRTKEYVALMHLGIETDTEDITGKVLSQKPVEISEEKIEEIIMSFIGPYSQIPPMYSAIKVNGKKLYELARAGIEIERQPRMVSIIDIEVLEYKLPFVKMRVECSKGTYIRSLCRDIGEKAGCGACMESLVRTRSGHFSISDSIKLSQIEEIVKNSGEIPIIMTDECFMEYPELLVSGRNKKLVENGNMFLAEENLGDYVRVYMTEDSEKKNFAGIYRFDDGFYKPEKLFLTGV